MFIRAAVSVLLLVLAVGCTGLTEGSRLDQFSQIAKSYERALTRSEYHTAAKYHHHPPKGAPVKLERFANIKIFRYKIKNIQVLNNARTIEQDVELQYFLLDRNILKTTTDHQVWRYNETRKVWMLESGMPPFHNQRSGD